MTGSKRITVRLSSQQITQVEQYRRETGSDMSALIRNSLRHFLNRRTHESQRSDGTVSIALRSQVRATNPLKGAPNGDIAAVSSVPAMVYTGGSMPITSSHAQLRQTAPVKAAAVESVRAALELTLPPSIAALIPQARGLGGELPKVRRLQFQRVVGATYVAMKNPENTGEAKLYAELIRIGHIFGLLA
jgi:Arc/MetJ-type ribon-helix-helix transcriptional regulator